MRRRVYWLLPDVASARATMDDLLLACIDLRHVHFLGRDDYDLSDLHAANVLQTTDVLRSAEAGLVVGAAIGGIVGTIAAVSYPGAGEGPQWNLVPLLVVAGALFDAWTSSMIGISVPNQRLQCFAPEIAQGRILLMVDVPPARVREIQARLQGSHPEARFVGIEPDLPSRPGGEAGRRA